MLKFVLHFPKSHPREENRRSQLAECSVMKKIIFTNLDNDEHLSIMEFHHKHDIS